MAAVTDVEGAAKIEDVRATLPTVKQVLCVGEPPSAEVHALAELLARAADTPTAPDPTASADPMLLYFTSGTVGYPKMVMQFTA